MKIMQINSVYNEGSTGKIVHDLHTELKENGIESIVCYGRGKKVKEQGIYKICGEFYGKLNALRVRLTGLMYGGCFVPTSRLIGIIKKERPDIVHLHCLNGNFVNIYRLIGFLKKKQIKTVLTLHAEFMYTANCGHALDCEKWKEGCGKCPRLKKETHSWFFDGTKRSWKKMKAAFDGFKNIEVVSVSPWLMERAKQSPILADKKHSVVLNGIDTDVFHFWETNVLKQNYGWENKKIIFHATPDFNLNPNHIKGGYYVAELAKKMLEKPIVFVIAGRYDPSENYPENMYFLGKVENQQMLAQLYSMADITLLTSQKETFSMVTAESLCCGTPVVGFKAGAPEQIALKEYSSFTEYGDLEALQEETEHFLQPEFEKAKISEKAIGEYSRKTMAKHYLLIYEVKK